jgi:polyadenylate-binding protein
MPQAAQVPQQGLAPIDFATLSQMDPAQQKQVLGAALYPRVAELRPAEAGKITGMLLEIEPAEVINLLESPEELRGAVNEAASVLESAAQQQPTTA